MKPDRQKWRQIWTANLYRAFVIKMVGFHLETLIDKLLVLPLITFWSSLTLLGKKHSQYINGINFKLVPNQNKENMGSVARTAACDWSIVRAVLA